ncbi:MAG: hypothetical protein ACI3ZL_07435 [Candidatus Cryptobacteroides sp.]
MKNITEFVSEHLADDTAALILKRDRWPEIDINLAVNCIESRRKLKGKLPEWVANQELVFPVKLSAEQCSGSRAARYKAAFAERIAARSGWRIADLTGGLGVDSWFFSLKAAEVLYCEMQKPLCDAATHNFKVLGAGNISVINRMTGSEKIPMALRPEGFATPEEIIGDFRPDIVYMDPARRSETGRKVFLIEECSPDVLSLKDELFRQCRHILLKLSPMADIRMVCDRLGRCCREVHVVSVGDECKELLIWMDREWEGEYSITAAELGAGSTDTFTFSPIQERQAVISLATEEDLRQAGCTDNRSEGASDEGAVLFEPGKAMMKAGAFNIVGEMSGMKKIGASTHYYIGSLCQAAKVASFGKVFRIVRCVPLDKKALKEAGRDFPGADITARNLPADTETYRKIMKSGPKGNSGPSSNVHIFCLRSDKAGAMLIASERIISSGVLDEGGQARPSQD